MPDDRTLDAHLVETCKAAASRIRRLPFREPVRTVSRSQSRLEATIRRAETRRQQGRQGSISRRRTLACFGLIPEDFDLSHYYQALEAEQLGGFYAPSRNTVVVIEKPQPRSPSPGATPARGTPLTTAETLRSAMLVHEFTHALQFQNLAPSVALAPSLSGSLSFDDAQVARSALLEGDAMFVTIQFLLGPDRPLELSIDAGRRMAEQLAHGASPWLPVMSSGPPAIRDQLLFPYLVGLDFVARLLRERGWAAVDAAYASPPLSTEQVLHPSRYLEGDRPMVVTVDGIARFFDVGYRTLATGRWGEWGVSLVLKYARGVCNAGAAAVGWGGDTYTILTRGEDWIVVWAIAWDRVHDAVTFENAWTSAEPPSQFPRGYQLARQENITLIVWGGPQAWHGDIRGLLQSVRGIALSPGPPVSVRATLDSTAPVP